MNWILLLSPNSDGVTNMARDEALLDLVRDTEGPSGIVRIYGWSHPVLSLGRHQRARDIYSTERASSLGVEIVRRPTGGRAVLHKREITYAAAGRIHPGSTLRDAAAIVDGLLLATLERLGVSAAVANPAARAPAPDAAPCFALPVRGELLANDLKLVGSAQWREDDAWMQHGSILVEDDQSMIEMIANDPSGQSSGSLATLAALLGRTVSNAEFHASLREVLRDQHLLANESDHADARIAARVDELANRLAARYADDAWTWRR